MLSTSPGPSRSVGRGGRVVSVGAGIAGGGGTCPAPCTSANLNGNCACSALAAFLISEPVGPLIGRVAQPARPNIDIEIKKAPRNKPLRRGTQIIVIRKPWRRSDEP